jgi:hypothetical protein
MQNACEPLHVQLNLNDSAVAVVNRKHHAIGKLTVEAKAYSLKTELLFSQTVGVDLGPEEIKKKVISLAPFIDKAMGISFIVLRLKDTDGNIISRNVYWLEHSKDYKALQQMPRSGIQVKLLPAENGKVQNTYKVQLTNTSRQLAFFLRLQLIDKKEEILPSCWSANYVTLAPGESMILIAEVPTRILKGKQPEVRVSGWNTEEQLPGGF